MNKLHKDYNMTADVIKFIRKAEQVSFEELDPTHHMMTINDQSTIVTSRSGIGRMIKMTNVENVEKMLVGSFDVREFAPIPMDVELELVLIEEIVAKNSNYEMENIWIMVDKDFKKI